MLTRTQTRDQLDRSGLHPKHRLGQHFLCDPNIARKMTNLADIDPTDRVLEIGTGTGALTVVLAERGARVLTFEIDTDLAPIIETNLSRCKQVEVRYADVSTVDLGLLLSDGSWKMVANLPYGVGTSLLLDTMQRVNAIESWTVMVQAEVAQRLMARPSTLAYGLPSLVVAYFGRIVDHFQVGPQVFFPVPEVKSTVIRIDRSPPPQHVGLALELARHAFGQRRKMLRRSLAEPYPTIVSALTNAGIDPRSRPEQLAPEVWLTVAQTLL